MKLASLFSPTPWIKPHSPSASAPSFAPPEKASSDSVDFSGSVHLSEPAPKESMSLGNKLLMGLSGAMAVGGAAMLFAVGGPPGWIVGSSLIAVGVTSVADLLERGKSGGRAKQSSSSGLLEQGLGDGISVRNDGRTSFRVGNQLLHSDGTSSTQIGNQLINSDGTSGTRFGNVVVNSNGTISFVF